LKLQYLLFGQATDSERRENVGSTGSSKPPKRSVFSEKEELVLRKISDTCDTFFEG
jgi:hypothetical protein